MGEYITGTTECHNLVVCTRALYSRVMEFNFQPRDKLPR